MPSARSRRSTPKPSIPGIMTSRITASGRDFAGPVQRGGAVGGGVDLEALELQAHREQLDDIGLVVDYEDSGLRDVFWECSHGHRLNVSQFPGSEAAETLSTSCESQIVPRLARHDG